MKREYAREYRELYERHWWWRAREALLLGELQRRQPPRGWGTILDVGCGDGLLFERLAPFGTVRGVEPDADLVSPTGPHRAHIEVAPFNAAYRPGRRFRLILMLDVLEHMSDPAGALRHAATLLEPGGWLLATVPAFRALWTAHDDFNAHLERYTVASFHRLAARGGFEVVSARYLFHWLFPVKLAVRAAEAAMPGRAKPARVPPNWLNTGLRRLSLAEARWLGWARLPFGTSVLAWCRPLALAEAEGDGI
ncbi:MAG: class I SAM-dependent methyltransferase [Gemmatimonadales bacterium]